MMLVLSSCNKGNDDNAKIQIWCYDFDYAGYYSDTLASVLANSRLYCELNKIPLEIVRYDEKTLSYEDYIIKRNTATANGNMIIIEDARYMYDLAKQHADYTKLDSYENLIDAYKDKYCIPLAIGYRVNSINNDAINYYGINTDRPLITYSDYLSVKQQMKESGAEFKLNIREFSEILDYYLDINGLRFVNEDSEILKDNNKFKESLKNTIIGMCDDFILYNDGLLQNYRENKKISTNDYIIYDETSDLTLIESEIPDSLTEYAVFGGMGESILEKTLIINPNVTFLSPCFFMYKKVTNNKIYDLANYIVNESTYLGATGQNHFFSPVFNTEKIRTLFEVNENWEYQGNFKTNAERGKEKDIRICKLINDSFDMLVKDEETSKLIANYYFFNRDYFIEIYSFVEGLTYKLANEKFDYKNENINKMIDDSIDEFITNFNVHHK